MKLEHLDNNHFKLSAAQARELSVTGKLPGPGREVRANLDLLAGAELVFDGITQPPLARSSLESGWILRTAVGKRAVWVIRLRFRVLGMLALSKGI